MGFRCDDTSSFVISGEDLKIYVEGKTHTLVDFADLSLNLKEQPSNSKEKQSKVSKSSDIATEEKNMVGLTVKKDEDFGQWYSQVLLKSEMMDYYDISGVI